MAGGDDVDELRMEEGFRTLRGVRLSRLEGIWSPLDGGLDVEAAVPRGSKEQLRMTHGWKNTGQQSG